jgi:hypothetical protein
MSCRTARRVISERIIQGRCGKRMVFFIPRKQDKSPFPPRHPFVMMKMTGVEKPTSNVH